MDRIILLGAKGGPAIRSGGPNPTAYLIDIAGRLYVVDCGLGVTRGFVEAGYHLSKLSTILITHHHSDHNLEFGNLIHTAWTAGLATPVNAYGPTGLKHIRHAFLELNRFDIETRIADEGRVCVLELELEGALTVQAQVPGSVTIFISADVAELERRLRERATESTGEIGQRIELARWQLEQAHRFRYMVQNDDVARAGAVLAAVVETELSLAGPPAGTMPAS